MSHVDSTESLRESILAGRNARKAAAPSPLSTSGDRMTWCCIDDNGSLSPMSDEDEESTIQGHQTQLPLSPKSEHARHSSAPGATVVNSQQHPARPSTITSFRSIARGKPLGPPPTMPLPPRPESSSTPTLSIAAPPRSFLPSITTDTDTSDDSGDELDSIRHLSSCFPSPGPTRSFDNPRSPASLLPPSHSTESLSDGEFEDVLQLTDHQGVLCVAGPSTASSRLSNARRDLGSRVSVSPTSPTGFKTPARSRPRRISSRDSIMQQKIIGLVAALDLHAEQMSSSSLPPRSEVGPHPSSPDTSVSVPSLASSSTLDLSHSLHRTDSAGSFRVPAIRVAESGKASFELDSIYDAYRTSNGSVMSHAFVPPKPPTDHDDSDTELESDAPRKRTKQSRADVGFGFDDQRAVRRDSIVRTNRLGSAFSPSLQSTAEESSTHVQPARHDPFAFYQFSPSLPPFVPSGMSPKDLTGMGTWSSIVARAASHTLRSRQPSVASLSSVVSTTGPVSLREVKAAAQAKQQLAQEEQRRRESLSAYVSAMTYRPFALHDHALANVRDTSPDGSLQSIVAGGRSTSLSSYSFAPSSTADFGTRWPVAIGEDQVNISPGGSVAGSRPASVQPKQYVEFCMQTSPTSSPKSQARQLSSQVGDHHRRASPSLRRKSSRLSMLGIHGLDLDEPGAWPVNLRAPRLASPNSASPLSRQSRHTMGMSRPYDDDDDEGSGNESEESDLDVSTTLEVLAERSGVWDDVRGAKRKLGVAGKDDRHSLVVQRKIASIPLRTPHRFSTALEHSRASESVSKRTARLTPSPTRSISPELVLASLEEDELSHVNLDEIDASHALLGDDDTDELSITHPPPHFGRTLAEQDTPNTTAGSEIWSSFQGDRSSTVSSATTYSVNSSLEDQGSRRTSAADVLDKFGTAAAAPTLRRKSSGLPTLAIPRSVRVSRSESNDSELLTVPSSPLPPPTLRRPQSVANLKGDRGATKIPSMLPSPVATAAGNRSTPSKLPSLRTAASTTSLRSRALASPLPTAPSTAMAGKSAVRSGLPLAAARTAPLMPTTSLALSQNLAR